jgi:surface polysaccharide O-acyltransferase-like enzyme
MSRSQVATSSFGSSAGADQVATSDPAKLSAAASLRMKLLRFPLIVGVVLVHSSETSVGLSQGQVGVRHAGWLGDFLINILSEGLGRSAVPLSLILAGYLLAQGFDGSYGGYTRRLKSRVHTLLLPFLFWNLFALGVYALAQALPITAAFMSGRHTPVAAFQLRDYAQALLAFGGAPMAYQFWFVKDLMLLVVLSPLLLRGLRVAPLPILLTLFILWFTGLWTSEVIACRAALFFCVGLAVGCHGMDLFKLDRHAKPITVLYGTLLLACASPVFVSWQPYLRLLAIAVGVAALLCWSAWAMKSQRLTARLTSLSTASFFVFAGHEPFLTAARKFAYVIVKPTSSVAVMVLYFLVPLLVISALVVVHRALSALLPGFTGFITGGRKAADNARVAAPIPTPVPLAAHGNAATTTAPAMHGALK